MKKSIQNIINRKDNKRIQYLRIKYFNLNILKRLISYIKEVMIINGVNRYKYE